MGGTKEVQLSYKEKFNEVAPCNDKVALNIYLKSPGNSIFEFAIHTIFFFPACYSKVTIGRVRVNFITSRVQFMVHVSL